MGPDIAALLASGGRESVAVLLAEDVVFHSPVADYSGRDDVAHLLATIARVLSDVRAVREYAEHSNVATHFTARVGDAAVEGMLLRRIDASGAVADATLWLRPLAALRDAVARMRDALAESPLPGSSG